MWSLSSQKCFSEKQIALGNCSEGNCLARETLCLTKILNLNKNMHFLCLCMSANKWLFSSSNVFLSRALVMAVTALNCHSLLSIPCSWGQHWAPVTLCWQQEELLLNLKIWIHQTRCRTMGFCGLDVGRGRISLHYLTDNVIVCYWLSQLRKREANSQSVQWLCFRPRAFHKTVTDTVVFVCLLFLLAVCGWENQAPLLPDEQCGHWRWLMWNWFAQGTMQSSHMGTAPHKGASSTELWQQQSQQEPDGGFTALWMEPAPASNYRFAAVCCCEHFCILWADMFFWTKQEPDFCHLTHQLTDKRKK